MTPSPSDPAFVREALRAIVQAEPHYGLTRDYLAFSAAPDAFAHLAETATGAAIDGWRAVPTLWGCPVAPNAGVPSGTLLLVGPGPVVLASIAVPTQGLG